MAMISSSSWSFPANRPTGRIGSATSTTLSLSIKNGRKRGDLRTLASSADAPDRPPDENSDALEPSPIVSPEAKASQVEEAATLSTDVPSTGSGNPNTGAPDKLKLALQRAKEYKKNKDLGGKQSIADSIAPEPVQLTAERTGEFENSKDAIAEAISRGREFERNKKTPRSGGEQPLKAGAEKTKMGKPGGLKVSSLDFLGFDFSDKKKGRGIPAGLVPTVDPSFGGDSPDVEIIVGDRSKFGPSTSSASELNSNESDENSGLYKPKVSTWGVFARPKDISKTFGGGKTIRPGDVLESAETKSVKEEYTRQMIAKYRNEIGLVIDPKVKAECEKVLKEGNQLMDAGRLREAIPYYEKVMNSVVFKNEFHGLAALQWSICQDSLGRSNDARIMYEKLQSHPNVIVSKKAKQFMFGFQAMEMMKIGNSSSSGTTGYETYFDAFLSENSNNIPVEAEEGDNASFWQAVPYLLLLVSPVFVILLAALRKTF